MTAIGLFYIGITLDLIGVLLISLDQIGRLRIERFEEQLRSLLRDMATPLFTPAYAFQTFQDLFFKRRLTFWFFMFIPILLLPQYVAWLITTPVWFYVHGLGILWLIIGAFCLPLVLWGLLLWVCFHQHARFPIWVDHLLTVAAFPFRPSLVLTLPAAIIFLLLPILLNFIFIKGLLYVLYAATVLLTHFPFLNPVRSSLALRLLGILCLSAGVTVQLITMF